MADQTKPTVTDDETKTRLRQLSLELAVGIEQARLQTYHETPPATPADIVAAAETFWDFFAFQA